MKTKIYTIEGKRTGEIDLPQCFSEGIRMDLIQRVVESKKIWQPYGPSPVAGNQYSASGKLKHHRKVWKSQYGRGMSRVPRKQMSRRGSQFNWVGATAPNTRGGRKVHSPKVLSMISLTRINKKEKQLALISAISATIIPELILGRYDSLNDIKVISPPYIVESKLIGLKSKDLIKSVKDILGEELFNLALRKKTIRAGRGKLRGRKYKSNLGLLIVIGNDEKFKTKLFEIQKVNKLGVKDLANGGVARLTIYTETAIKDLREKFK